MFFTNIGRSVADACGHEHETRDEAQACLTKHQAECRQKGKVSHRLVVELESMDEVEDLI